MAFLWHFFWLTVIELLRTLLPVLVLDEAFEFWGELWCRVYLCAGERKPGLVYEQINALPLSLTLSSISQQKP